MHIETPKKTIQKSSKEVYDFLLDIKNFEHLMPENISKFEVLNEERFLFALKGMPEIVLQLKESTPTSKVVLGAASDKLPFTLTANIDEISANESEVVLNFEGEFNAMMAMMIKSPITNFMGTLSDNLAKV
ncbi:SRPBCC family protein [Cellulophaga baltica]|uniref:SRPBCC family protein n=1 Tax=Cellulophaga TaxID=104264 RepID=UPI001C06B418|nr:MULTISPECIES: SRPBCC family protein [Cellulophaga]MBU2994975.1 SRPBCC family protein [Cellulophaga baltica]MDO6766370.1 SRPBCC family protein [Cellulophaga sp. 1_MG-2023]